MVHIVYIIIAAVGMSMFAWVGLLLFERVKNQARFMRVRFAVNKKNLKEQESREPALLRYSDYTMSLREKLFYIALSAVVLYIIGMIFYKSFIASTLIASVSVLYPRIRTEQLAAKRKQELRMQFKQALYSLSSSLSSGKSIENSFHEAVKDLRLLYPDPRTCMIREIEIMNRRVENGETIEKALHDFSLRAEEDDISSFSNVFLACKRTGGDMVEVIRRASSIIGDKIDMQQEISVMIAQKRFESRILVILPFVIVAFLSFSSPDYMATLYRGSGILIMTSALVLLLFCYWIAQRIMDIKV